MCAHDPAKQLLRGAPHMMLGVACVMDGTVCATRCFSEKGGVSAMHKAQTGMLAEEARGVDLPFSLMLVHGQDHLMTTIMFGRMARELVEVYKELRAR